VAKERESNGASEEAALAAAAAATAAAGVMLRQQCSAAAVAAAAGAEAAAKWQQCSAAAGAAAGAAAAAAAWTRQQPRRNSMVAEDNSCLCKVAKKGILFAAAFLATAWPAYANFLLRTMSGKAVDAMQFIELLVCPLLGFCNVLFFLVSTGNEDMGRTFF